VARRKKKNPVSEYQFSRRSFLLAGAQAALGGVLLGRLFYLGGYRGSDYKALANENRIKVQFLLPKRGKICDRHGQILAANEQSYRLMLVPDQVVNMRQSLKAIQAHYPLTNEAIETLVEETRFRPKFIAVSVVSNLTWAEVCRLEVAMRDFSGCYIEQGWARFYPKGEATAHLVGYVQAPSQEDQQENPVYRLPDFRTGKSGIEKIFNESLHGQVGYRHIEVNARSRTVRELKRHPSIPGKTCMTSVDFDLQNFIQERLAQESSGCAVVMNIKSGEVLALNSSPSFDANLFTNGISPANWKELLNNPYGCLNNKVTQGLYPPGSLFKMVVALAAFESGIAHPDYVSTCNGYIDVGGHRFHCWHKQGGHGSLTIVRALRESCDVYFFELAQKVGVDRLVAMAERLGFGNETGIELPSERSGLVPTKDWKMRILGQSWRVGDTINMGIGQGAMLATPMQLVVMMARLVNPQGLAVEPTLLLNNTERDAFEPLGLNPKYLKLLKQGLDETVNMPQGLAYRNRILTPGFEMGGKTATCQVRRITMAERKRGVLKNEQRPWEQRDHGLFLGYAPIHDPTYATVVVVEHGGGGGGVAAPIGRDILLKVQQLNQEDTA
jgi:penicillin-binding protein 2